MGNGEDGDVEDGYVMDGCGVEESGEDSSQLGITTITSESAPDSFRCSEER